MKYAKGLVFILIAANLIISLYLSYIYIYKIDPFCLTGQGCNIVSKSPYSHILGIPLSYLGVFYFAILFILYYYDYKKKLDKKIFPTFVIIGFVASLYFLYLQLFVIKAICSSCFAVDIIMIIISSLVLYNKKGY